MQTNLAGKRVAILAADGFELSELIQPLKALRNAGAEVQVVSQEPGQIQGMTRPARPGAPAGWKKCWPVRTCPTR